MKSETDSARTGRLGEERALSWLREAGYEIVARNWRTGCYELDLVARRGGELHFIEVKTRREGSLVPPDRTLNRQKRRALRRAAEAFLARSGDRFAGCDVRFDLAAVRSAGDGSMRIEWYPDAVEYGW